MERAYPQALRCLRAAEAVGLAGGELRTWGGRLLRFPGGSGPGAGRYARNAVVQGAAAELFKVWAVTVRAGLAALGGEIVLCLHDELLLQVPEARRSGRRAPAAQRPRRGDRALGRRQRRALPRRRRRRAPLERRQGLTRPAQVLGTAGPEPAARRATQAESGIRTHSAG